MRVLVGKVPPKNQKGLEVLRLWPWIRDFWKFNISLSRYYPSKQSEGSPSSPGILSRHLNQIKSFTTTHHILPFLA